MKRSVESAPGPPLRPVLWPLLARFAVLFLGVSIAHATLLKLPYFWDEGGYYVPAALDFYHRWTLIPEFTNAHPPLPNVVLGLLWHVFGYHIVVTRLTACAFAAAGLLAVFELGRRLLGAAAAAVLTLLTAVYPIWFAQSSLAHADIFAAAFTLAGLCVYLTHAEVAAPLLQNRVAEPGRRSAEPGRRSLALVGLLFCLAVLSKETALIYPAVLAMLEAFEAVRNPARRSLHLRWTTALCTPVPVLALWFAYHRWKTGFTFGNPTFLQYNATANLTVAHVARALQFRLLHLFWQRDMWLPIVLAAACLLLPRRHDADCRPMPPAILRAVAVLVFANWIAFSVLGGALLTRYLLPIYPLILLVCLWLWQRHTRRWPWLAALTAAAFLSALWLNPPTYFAPEDNLTYRDMIVVHQEAIAWLEQHTADATVLTAWPAAGELSRPELGYTQHRFKVFGIENFSTAEIAKAAQQPGRFDTALVFATHYASPVLRHYLLTHPNTARARAFAAERDLSPAEVARMLGGTIVWHDDLDGEWAAVLRFNRAYNAQTETPASLPQTTRCSPPTSFSAPCSPESVFPYTRASIPRP